MTSPLSVLRYLNNERTSTTTFSGRACLSRTQSGYKSSSLIFREKPFQQLPAILNRPVSTISVLRPLGVTPLKAHKHHRVSHSLFEIIWHHMPKPVGILVICPPLHHFPAFFQMLRFMDISCPYALTFLMAHLTLYRIAGPQS